MADSKSYQKFPEVTILFGLACENETKATDALTDALNLAETTADKWPEDIFGAWTSGLKPLMQSIQPNSVLAPEVRRLLQALLDSGVDSPEMREAFVALFRNLNPRCANPQGYVEAIGFRNSEIPVRALSRRMKVCMAIQDGVCCYNSAFGGGVITAVDELNTEVKVQEERVRGVALTHFLDTMTIIRKDSVMEKLVRGQAVPAFASREAFESEAAAALISAAEAAPAMVKGILVPGVMDEKAYTAIFDPNAKAAAAEASAKAAAPVASAASQRWDNSRSIAELEGRLAAAETLHVEDGEMNAANVENLLTRDCHRKDLADKWAASVAMIRRSDLFNEKLGQLLDAHKANVASWNDVELFVAISDKMPGKLVPFWFAASYEGKGADFLAAATVKMPFRLWTHTERILNQNKEIDKFRDAVFQAFQQGNPSADHYVWLWKAPKSEVRTKYLSDSYMLFKTLHKDVRGNYLKSRREVHKLLMDNETFQRALMNDGDEDAVRNLIRCVNHLPLLEGNEKQSLLVKIVRIFPEMKKMVESTSTSGARTVRQAPRLRLTSKRSYMRVRAEFEHLVNVEIPANIAAIETARAHGDLSENSEYKYAKEQQRLLGSRRTALDKDLNTVKPFDFGEQQVEKLVIPGCVVTLRYKNDGREEVLNLLGIFDGDSDRAFYSYDSPMGRVLMTRSVGETVTVPAGTEAVIADVKPLPKAIIDELNNTDI